MRMISGSFGRLWMSTIAVLALAHAGMTENVGASAPDVQTAVTSPSGMIDDTAAGWIWHGMVGYEDPSLRGGTAHAGGPGSYGAYTFRGGSVVIAGYAGDSVKVDGRLHKMGRAKISIDGKAAGSINLTRADGDGDVVLYTLHGLSDSLHVLQIEPEGGWAVVDYIDVTTADASPGGSGDEVDVPKGDIKSIIPAGSYYLVCRKDARQCLALSSNDIVDGTQANIYHLAAGVMETWTVKPLGGERYRLAPASTPGKCLALLTQVVTDDGKGYKVGTWQVGTYAAGEWYITRTDTGYLRISSVYDSTRVLDVSGGYMGDGGLVNGYPWNAGENQQWQLIPAKG